MALSPEQGMLLIPDISGYTEFLNEVEIIHGSHIVSELLEVLIRENTLGLTLNEVEGDALLFFRIGAPPAFATLMEQVRRWFLAFHARLNVLRRDTYCTCGACNHIGHMTLKVVAHYGEVALHQVGPSRRKMIGRDVVLTHRLLKNTIPIHEYLLLSESLFRRMAVPGAERAEWRHFEEIYPVFGEVSVACYDLGPLLSRVPPAPAREDIPPQRRRIEASVTVRAPLDEVAGLLTDMERQMLWIDGIRSVDLDHTAPLRAGRQHMCVVRNHQLHQVMDHILRGEDAFRMIVRIRYPRWVLRAWYLICHARRSGGAVEVSLAFTYTPRPLTGWMFELMMGGQLRRMLQRSAANLKRLLEGEGRPPAAGPPPGAPARDAAGEPLTAT